MWCIFISITFYFNGNFPYEVTFFDVGKKVARIPPTLSSN